MSHHRYHSSAPFGIKILAALAAVDGLQSMFRAFGMMRTSVVLALAVAVVAGLHLALSYGLWQMEPYAYALGLAIFGVGAALDLLTGNIEGTVLSGITISMLYHYRGLFRD